MGIFRRKKGVSALKVVTANLETHGLFGSNITKSDVVRICIHRIASQCGKLQGRHIQNTKDKLIARKEGRINFLLTMRPNSLMTPYQFIYKVISLLLLNENAFIYPVFKDGEFKELYPLNPTSVTPILDGNNYYFKFEFADTQEVILPQENVLHLKNFFIKNDIFGGNGDRGDNEAILKTIQINENLLQGIDGAIKSSMQIKGILKMNGMLSEKDKSKQLDTFNQLIAETLNKKGSTIVPMDLKAEYVPLTVDPKLVDKDTLEFLQKKILNYYGVSIPIFNNEYTEEEFNSFYESTIEPLAIQLSEVFSNGLLTDKLQLEGEQIKYFSERLQYASWKTKVEAIEKLMGLGLISLNESRALLGLEPVEGGNKRLQSLNYVDADKANKYQIGQEEENDNEGKD